jgi:hypothetical protein
VIERDSLPTMRELITKLSNISSFTEADSSTFGASSTKRASFLAATNDNHANTVGPKGLFCFNCESKDHSTYKCDKVHLDCEVCGF